MREAAIYEPEVRRQVERNLYCPHCGNTNQWQIDLRLFHNLQLESGGISIMLDRSRVDKVLDAINRHIERMVFLSEDNDRPFIHCANCSNASLDLHQQMLEMCYNSGCPGCFHCGNWIEEKEVRDTCVSCIQDHSGSVDEDFCFSSCPHYDYGLDQVRQHYNITLQELKSMAGYDDG
jgi:hypothetical protein